MKTLGIVVIALLSGAGAFYYLHQKNKPVTEAAIRRSLRVGPEFKLVFRSTDCRIVSFAEFSGELQRTGGFADKFMAPTEDSATVSVAVEGNQQCPLPYPMLTTMPPFEGVDLEGHPVSRDDLRGHMTLVSFFWKNCGACIREVEHLNEMQRLYPEVRMIAMTFESPERARAFQQEHQLKLPVIPDQEKFITAAMVRAYPAQIFYDAQGKMLGRRSGWPVDEDKQADARAQMDDWMTKLLAFGKTGVAS